MCVTFISDEPTGDLDTVNTLVILGLLMQLNRQERITCIMVTHDQQLKHYAHRVVNMVSRARFKVFFFDFVNIQLMFVV